MRKRVITVCALGAIAVALARPAEATPIFTFDDVGSGTLVPFTRTSEGVTATFSSTDGAVFNVLPTFLSTLTGNVLLDADAQFHVLNIAFSSPFDAVTLRFALNGPATNTFMLTALLGGTVVGSAAATGNIPTGFFFPEGSISFGGAAFDTIRLAATAPDFAIDNVALGTAAVPEPGTLFLCIIVVGMALRRRARQHLS